MQTTQMERATRELSREHHGTTTVHPVGISVLALLSGWIFSTRRQRAILPLLILICFIPSAQRIVVLGADFTFLRILILVALARVLIRNELATIRFNKIDVVFVAWVLVGSLVYVLQQGDPSAAVYVSGTSMDQLGAYFVTRALVRDIGDLRRFAVYTALLALFVSVFFAVEFATRQNMFSIFGGVPETTMMRQGKLRCQGAFSHPILAGVFWASIGAFLMGAFLGGRRRVLFGGGVLACVFIIGTTASSTPLLGFLSGVAFWLAWPFRKYMRWGFIGAPFVVAGLHIIMQAPVWHLVSRVSAVGGSTGYHRYVLIDGAIRHFHEWWLLGTTWTGHWSEHFQTWDIANQYIFEGVRGGIWRLGLFCSLVVFVGNAIAGAQGRARTKADRYLLWGFGASLFVHCVCFIGVSYFGQIQYLWYMTLAIGSAAASAGFVDAPAIDRKQAERHAARRLGHRPIAASTR